MNDHGLTSLESALKDAFCKPEGVIYLDAAATAPRFRAGVERMDRFYADENANIHRGTYPLSIRATNAYEEARGTVANLLFHASTADEVVFTGGATDSANMLAHGLAHLVDAGSNIVVSVLEHHSNLLPWKRVADERGAELRIAPCTYDGALDMDACTAMIDGRTRIVALTGQSNVTGFRPDLSRVAEAAHGQGAILVIDAAQRAAHGELDVSDGGADAVFVSAHKLGGPMGVGALWATTTVLEELEPLRLGGGAVASVAPDGTAELAGIPQRFEAGTQDVAGVLGFAAALEERERLGCRALFEHEATLADRLRAGISDEDSELELLPAEEGDPIIAIVPRRCSAYDFGTLLASEGVAVRSGRHCAHPYLDALGVEGVCRLSLSIATTVREVDDALEAIRWVCGYLGGV